MISGAGYYLTLPIRHCLRSRPAPQDCAPTVQSGGRPTCTQKMQVYARAAYAGVQKALGQLLSATSSELIGGAMPLLGTAITEAKGAETGLVVGIVLMEAGNFASGLHSSSVVQDAFGISNRAKGTILLLSCTLPLIEAFAFYDSGEHASASEIPARIVYIMLGRMLSNACRDFINEFLLKGFIGDTKHVGADNKDLSKSEIVRRRGNRLLLGPLPDNVGSAALVQFVVKSQIKVRLNVSDIATDSVAELSLVGEHWRGTAASALASGVVKAFYAFWGELAKAYAANNDAEGGTLLYAEARFFKAIRENFGPKFADALLRWKDATSTRNLLGPLSDAVAIWGKFGYGNGVDVNGVASLVGGGTEMRTPAFVDRAAAGREARRQRTVVTATVPPTSIVQPLASLPLQTSDPLPSVRPDPGLIAQQAMVSIAGAIAQQSPSSVQPITASATATTTTTTTPMQTTEETVVTVRVLVVKNTPLPMEVEMQEDKSGRPAGLGDDYAPLLPDPESGSEVDSPVDESVLPPVTVTTGLLDTKEGRTSPDESSDEESPPVARYRSASTPVLKPQPDMLADESGPVNWHLTPGTLKKSPSHHLDED